MPKVNSQTTLLEKAPTGINGFDEITGGGLPAGRPTLVCGSAGCGKSLFGAGLRILLVEDHEDTRQIFRMILTQKGHSVQTAATAKAALTLADNQPFDLVISDLGLPDLSGTDLMRILRERYFLRGVAVSGYGMEKDIRESKSAGFDHHLTKPADPAKIDQLLAEVTMKIRRPRSGLPGLESAPA
jgi:CheY-like chemotaxis protein